MSANNLFNTRRKGFVLRTAATSAATYTVKVGSVTDNFIVDRVLDVTTLDTVDCAITVPNGLYEGQRVLINYTAEGATGETAVVTPDLCLTTTSYSLGVVGDYCSLEWMNSTEGWAHLSEQTT